MDKLGSTDNQNDQTDILLQTTTHQEEEEKGKGLGVSKDSISETSGEEEMAESSPIQLERNELSLNKEHKEKHKVYPIRYLMLTALVVLNISNGIMWLSFAPVPSLTASFYDVTLSDVDWFSTSYFIASLLFGFVSIIILDVAGLRTAVICGAVCNLLGAILRYISTLDAIVCSTQVSKAGYITAIIGQILTAFAQPFFLYAPAKLANTWFGSKERAICTNLASVANPLGIAIAQLATPRIVTEVNKLPTMLWIYIIPAGVGAILSVSFYRSTPPVPPTASGDVEQLPFLTGLKKSLKNWNFLVLLASWGLAAGGTNAILIIIPQYLCPYGYSNQTVGLWGSLLIFFGLFGATAAGILIDFTKLFKEIGVLCYTFAIFCLIWFVEVATIENQPFLVAVPLCLFGLFGLAIIPVSMELGIEFTYPAPEATSSGLLWSSAQIFGIIFVTLGQFISPVIKSPSIASQCGVGLDTPTNSSATVCSDRPPTSINADVVVQDWTNTGLVLISMATIAYLLFVIFLKPDYKRNEREKDTENSAKYEEK